MTSAEFAQAARDLYQAEKTGQQIGLLSQRFPHLDLDGAYAIQQALIAHKTAQGQKVIGWKIGLTSRAMQQALNIDTPDSGVLLDDMLFEDGAQIPQGRFIQPRVEAEIAFVLKADLKGAAVTRQDVLDAIDYVSPSLEILDTRIQRIDPATGKSRVITDTISDNAANAGIVMGKARHAAQDFDLRWVGAIVKREGIVEETGLGAGVLNDPIMGILWLIHRLAAYDQGIKAGEILLSGSFIRPIETYPNCLIEADFGPFGAVSVTF